MPKKDTRLNVRAPTELVERLARAAEIIDRPGAQIAREAINEKLAQLAEQHPEINDRDSARAA